MLGRISLTNKIVSKQLSIDEKVVASVTDFIFKELNEELVRMEEPTVYVRGLGTFGINNRAVENRILFLIKCIRSQEQQEREGRFYNKRDSMIRGMKNEISRLFKIRRMLRNRKEELKSLKCKS